MIAAETLTKALDHRARRHPQALALVFIAENGEEGQLTARDFHERALASARALAAQGVQPDDVVVLVLQHSIDLLTIFWGALYLGAIPSIFPFLTEKLDGDVYRQQVQALVAHAQAHAIVTYPAFQSELEQLLSEQSCTVLSTADLREETAAPLAGDFPEVEPDQIAFLQHSSGTTGLQKGVALSHRAVLNQIRAYSAAIELQAKDTIVSWLPLYHDMGLIAGFVMPLAAGIPLILLSPFHWVRDPVALFKAGNKYGGTLCWLPNFAYNHSVRAIRQRDLQDIRLDHWRLIINCSEPVRHESHLQFLQQFAPYGLRADALATCYAMAENTFAVTQSSPLQQPHVEWVALETLQSENRATPRAAGSSGAVPFVSCGAPIAGTEIKVVTENGQAAAEREVGEILIRSNCMLTEYYHRPQLTLDAFDQGWYRSGDLGYLAGGQLYVTGRKKELIIVGGKNIYPQDVEAVAATVPGVYPGRAVAFGLPNERLGTEGVVLVCEMNGVEPSQHKQVENELRQRVLHHVGIALSDVRLVEQRWLLKTSSGKLPRSLNREKYLQEFRP